MSTWQMKCVNIRGWYFIYIFFFFYKHIFNTVIFLKNVYDKLFKTRILLYVLTRNPIKQIFAGYSKKHVGDKNYDELYTN